MKKIKIMNNKDFCKWVDNRLFCDKHETLGHFSIWGNDELIAIGYSTENKAWRVSKEKIMSKAEHYFKLKYPTAKLTEVCEQGAYGKTKVSVAIEVEGLGFEDDLVVIQKTETDIWQNALKAAFKHNNQ